MANETKHTPGPWHEYNASHGRILSHWHVGGPDYREGLGAICKTTGEYIPEVEHANARLIAAAPELLEAVELAELELRQLGSPRSALTTLQEAIAKVKGKA